MSDSPSSPVFEALPHRSHTSLNLLNAMHLYTRPRFRAEWPWGAFFVLPLFGLPFGAWLIEHGHFHFNRCGMKAAFDLPCLSCGSTRATLRLLHGDILGAFALQPMMMSIYAVLLLWGLISLWGVLKRRRLVIEMNDLEDGIFKVLLIGVPVGNWFYLYMAGI